MYHCHLQFYLMGRDEGLFDSIREMPPLDRFSHAFSHSVRPDAALCRQADVILADLRGLDGPAALGVLLDAKRDAAQLIAVAGREQLARLTPFLPQVKDLWLDPAAEEIPFRFLRWQEGFRQGMELWEREQYLEVAANSVPSQVWFKDKNGIYERVNDGFCRTAGKTREQVLGRDHNYIWDMEHDDTISAEAEREVMESRKTLVSEEPIPAVGGELLLTIYRSPLYDVDGSVMGTVGLGIDITRERAFQKEVVRKNKMLESLFTSMDCGMFVHSLDGKRVLRANRAALDIMNCSSKEELMAAGFDMVAPIIAEEDKERLRQCLRSLHNEGDSADISYYVRHPDGKLLYIMSNIKLIRLDGELVCQRLLLDCTVQKNLEHRERQEQERRQLELIRALTADFTRVYFFDWETNQGIPLRMEGGDDGALSSVITSDYSMWESLDLYIEHFVWPDDQELFRRKCSRERMQRKLEQKGVFYLKYRVIVGGEPVYHQIKAVRVGDWSRYRGVVLGVRNVDLQTREELEQKDLLREALSQANQASQAKSAFLSSMSHDIRTPMNAIIGFTVLLNKDAERPDKVREYTRKISASSHHLLSLINDVLDMSKIESGKTSLNIAPFSLPGLMEGLYTILRPQAKAKGQTFEFHVYGHPAEQLLGDQLHLNQILINLLSNAIKYTPDGGKISLSVENFGPADPNFAHLRFTVRDNGIGMSKEYMETVFDPFTRETTAASKGIQGTGLGMAITKNLVELMNGQIQVESRLGEGSVFTVELSFSLPACLDEERFWEMNGISSILVADDNEQVCLDIRAMMEDTGVQVAYATDGPTAVDVAVNARNRGETFNVILVDWKMPGQDGVETVRQLRKEIGHDVPILLLTSYDWSDIEDEAMAAGINAFMPKPFFESTFRQVLSGLDPTQGTGAAAQPSEDALKGMFFLVVEDNELNAEILYEMLNMEGADSELAANGKLAVEQFLRAEPDKYDMILMDVQMPVMDGYEATRQIRASSHPRAAEIPIVAMTANAFAEDARRALDAGMDGHLPKPIDMNAMRELLGRLRDGKKQQKNSHT